MATETLSLFALLKAILSGGRSEIEKMEKENPKYKDSIKKAKMYLQQADDAWANTDYPLDREIKM